MHAYIAGTALAAVLVSLATPASAEDARPARTEPAAPQAAPLADGSAKSSAPKGPQLWGFVNLQFSRTDAPSPANDSSTFELRRARIGARGDVTPQIGYAVLFDGADTSLKDAYGVLKRLPVPGIELRVGQFKPPFGYEQQERDTKLLWVNGSYVVQALARSTTTTSLGATSDSRDLGAGAFGRWAVGRGVGVELAAAVANGAGPNRRDDLAEKNVWGRAGVSAKAGPATVRAGASYGNGNHLAGLGVNKVFDGGETAGDDTSFYFATYGADVTLDTPWLFAAAELIQSERDVRDAGVRSNVNARGWYAGVYGKTPWNVGPVLRAERYDRDRAAANDLNERYTLGAYVDVLPVNARLVFNYELDESDRAVRTGDRAIGFAQVIF
jgi:hypothetical protein